jgi:hypothetical protein
MFALTDKAERKYFEVPVIYKGSLLYIVSGLCEQDPDADKPLLGMQRYWLGKVPYKRADILASRAWRIPPVSPGVRRTTPRRVGNAGRHGMGASRWIERWKTVRSTCSRTDSNPGTYLTCRAVKALRDIRGSYAGLSRDDHPAVESGQTVFVIARHSRRIRTENSQVLRDFCGTHPCSPVLDACNGRPTHRFSINSSPTESNSCHTALYARFAACGRAALTRRMSAVRSRQHPPK